MTWESHSASGKIKVKLINCRGLSEDSVMPVLLMAWDIFFYSFGGSINRHSPCGMCVWRVYLILNWANSFEPGIPFEIFTWSLGDNLLPIFDPIFHLLLLTVETKIALYPAFLWLGKDLWAVLANERHLRNIFTPPWMQEELFLTFKVIILLPVCVGWVQSCALWTCGSHLGALEGWENYRDTNHLEPGLLGAGPALERAVLAIQMFC